MRAEEREQAETLRGRRAAKRAAHQARMARKDADRLLAEGIGYRAAREIIAPESLRADTKSQEHFKTFHTHDAATGGIRAKSHAVLHRGHGLEPV
jgi:hypothetical protein